ncbi:GIY-YIG nuclease family protein [Leptospira interrogans]
MAKAKKPKSPDQNRTPPFETDDLRKNLTTFLDTPFGIGKIGDHRWGVYAFFDYDGEPIYVGQTNERVRVRIRRHLTNQRTDAVAMSVLDPFEVFKIVVWPLPGFQDITKSGEHKDKFKDAKAHLNALERLMYDQSVAASKFGAILNEKDAPVTSLAITEPPKCEGQLVSDAVYAIRSHVDFRISRRALIISRLAQVISERELKTGGLRRVMLVQSQRLESLARRRFEALGGKYSVPVKKEDEEETDGEDDGEEIGDSE